MARRSMCAGASTGGAFGNAPPNHSTVRVNQRSRSDQTIRGENDESNDVPSVTPIVVMLAVTPPWNAICADPDTDARHVPSAPISTAVLPSPAHEGQNVVCQNRTRRSLPQIGWTLSVRR